MKTIDLPSQEYLRDIFNYDENTGILTWKSINEATRRIGIGDEAGHLNKRGYRGVKVDTKLYNAHRVIYKWYYGEEPEQIDHINHIKDDNRICNLRNVTNRVNCCNKVKPYKNNNIKIFGVSYNKKDNKYRARIVINGKSKYLGYFNCPLLAGLAYQRAKQIRDN